MTNLRFKDYTFRHNPRKIVVRYLKETAQSRCYGFGASLQELGSGLTIVEGEGELFGSDALVPFLIEKIKTLGTAACPPYHIAFVIGGTSAEKNLLTKLLRIGRKTDRMPSLTSSVSP